MSEYFRLVQLYKFKFEIKLLIQHENVTYLSIFLWHDVTEIYYDVIERIFNLQVGKLLMKAYFNVLHMLKQLFQSTSSSLARL